MKPTPTNQSDMTDGDGADMGSTQGARRATVENLGKFENSGTLLTILN